MDSLKYFVSGGVFSKNSPSSQDFLMNWKIAKHEA